MRKAGGCSLAWAGAGVRVGPDKLLGGKRQGKALFVWGVGAELVSGTAPSVGSRRGIWGFFPDTLGFSDSGLDS